MRPLAVANALILFAAPTAGFVLQAAQRHGPYPISWAISDLDTLEDFDAKVVIVTSTTEPEPERIATTSSSVGDYDPSDDYIGDNSLAQIEIDLLELSLDEQSSCICRDLDGNPLSPEYFAQKMDIERVDRYICPEKDAFHGLMSNGGRVHLFPGGETAFYKRIAFEDLEHAKEKLRDAPHKLVRDAKSYHVVGSFLLSKGCSDMVEATDVRIPKCYDAQLEPNDANVSIDLPPSDMYVTVHHLRMNRCNCSNHHLLMPFPPSFAICSQCNPNLAFCWKIYRQPRDGTSSGFYVIVRTAKPHFRHSPRSTPTSGLDHPSGTIPMLPRNLRKVFGNPVAMFNQKPRIGTSARLSPRNGRRKGKDSRRSCMVLIGGTTWESGWNQWQKNVVTLPILSLM